MPHKIEMNIYNKLNIIRHRLKDYTDFIDKSDIADKNNTIYSNKELYQSFINGLNNTIYRTDYDYDCKFLYDRPQIHTPNNFKIVINHDVFTHNIKTFLSYINTRSELSLNAKIQINDYLNDIKSIKCFESSSNIKIRARMFFFKLLKNVNSLLFISNATNDKRFLDKMAIIGSGINCQCLIELLIPIGFKFYEKIIYDEC